MSDRYSQGSVDSDNSRFSNALFASAEHSRMSPRPTHYTTFNAGDIIPIYCREVLPNETLGLKLRNFVVRQTTLLTPTMGEMDITFYSFFVPNRVVNKSWKAVEGENYSGSWVAADVSLAPLVSPVTGTDVRIPVGSVADYYGFPTQEAISVSVLSKCHDLKFRGYVAIYNEYFRDQNYQPPIPISYLNVYQDFMHTITNESIGVPLSNSGGSTGVNYNTVPDGSFGPGAIAHSLYGSGSPHKSGSATSFSVSGASLSGRFYAVDKPLKANKLHDYFTSVLPSPQKSNGSILAPVSGSLGSVPVITTDNGGAGSRSDLPGLTLLNAGSGIPVTSYANLAMSPGDGHITTGNAATGSAPANSYYPSNLVTEDSQVYGLSLSVDDIRMSAALQQCYEILARGGSRYRSIVATFFGIDVDDPFDDIPKCLGKVSRSLELYQTAQTAASESGSTPQGNLAAFGYTSSSCELFSPHKFLEHGYVHVFAVVRHRNIYSSYLSRDNFRLNMLDFYLPPLANISEQPVYTREINPFSSNADDVFGYQEAWAEYRYEPDMVSGYMRPGITGSLALWNYADDFDDELQIADGEWLKSNSQEVLDRSLAVTSNAAPQFKASFSFEVDKDLPMPTYSIPGLDII